MKGFTDPVVIRKTDKMLAKLSLLLISILTSHIICGQVITDEKFSPKLGVCTSVNNHDLVSKAGFDYIEEGTGRFLVPDKPEEDFLANLRILENSSIPVLACNGFLPGKLKSTGPEIHHDEILDYAETAFRRASLAGVRYIVFGSSGSRNYPEGFDREKAIKQFTSLLKKMGPLAAKYNIIVVIEPLRKEESNLVNRVEEAYIIALEVNHPNIKVLGDIYHMVQENETPESLIEARQILSHMHIAEKNRRTAPGLAGDNFIPYLEALKKAGYKGGISIEGNWGPKEDFEKNLILARAYLQGQINAMPIWPDP